MSIGSERYIVFIGHTFVTPIKAPRESKLCLLARTLTPEKISLVKVLMTSIPSSEAILLKAASLSAWFGVRG
jgi:hypothetical protein